jgi:hypothetical protein
VPSEEHVLLLYSLVKRLVGLGCLRPALQQGWQLLADADAAAGARPDSQALRDVRSAARLNVLICSSEPSLSVVADLPRLASVVRDLVAALRCVGPGSMVCASRASTAVDADVHGVCSCLCVRTCRCQPPAAAAAHADVLVKYLLKVRQ